MQPVGQQWSVVEPEQLVMGTCRQAKSHVAGDPTGTSRVQGSPSSGQVVGQLDGGSQVSPASTFPSPQDGAQSVSFDAEQPAGQQPSLFRQVTIGMCVQLREQSLAEPLAMSVVQALPSSQVLAQAPGNPAVMAR